MLRLVAIRYITSTGRSPALRFESGAEQDDDQSCAGGVDEGIGVRNTLSTVQRFAVTSAGSDGSSSTSDS